MRWFRPGTFCEGVQTAGTHPIDQRQGKLGLISDSGNTQQSLLVVVGGWNNAGGIELSLLGTKTNKTV